MWQPCPRGPGNEANSRAHEGCRECCPTLGCHGVPGADDVQSRLCLVLCGLHAAAGAEAVLRWPELHVNLSCSCLTCSRGWRQPLTRPGALTDWPQGQRLNPAQPLRDQSARPRSPGEPWVAPVSSLPRGGPGQTMAGRRSERDGHGLHSHLLPLRLAPRCSVAWPLCLASSQGYKDLCLPLPYGPGS